MMPQLRCHDRHQTHFHRKSRQRPGAQLTKIVTPSGNGGGVEIAGSAERYPAQKLRDKRRFRFSVKAVQRRAEDNFVQACHKFWHPPFGQQTEKVFIPKPAKAPAWM